MIEAAAASRQPAADIFLACCSSAAVSSSADAFCCCCSGGGRRQGGPDDAPRSQLPQKRQHQRSAQIEHPLPLSRIFDLIAAHRGATTLAARGANDRERKSYCVERERFFAVVRRSKHRRLARAVSFYTTWCKASLLGDYRSQTPPGQQFCSVKAHILLSELQPPLRCSQTRV